MKHIGLLSPERLTSLLNWVGVPVVILYLVGMFAYPWIAGHGTWIHVQDVWDRWQALNVGMLAFVASLVVFSMSRYNAEMQRQRDFLAAKAFLPAALSALIEYFKGSASTLVFAWSEREGGGPERQRPELPEDYKEVFGQCIRYAATEVGHRMAYILARLQVHDARLRDLTDQLYMSAHYRPDRTNLIPYLYRLGELQAQVNKLFDFARGEGNFDPDPLTWEDYRSAYTNLDIQIADMLIDEQMSLEAFTKRAIAREARLDT